MGNMNGKNTFGTRKRWTGNNFICYIFQLIQVLNEGLFIMNIIELCGCFLYTSTH